MRIEDKRKNRIESAFNAVEYAAVKKKCAAVKMTGGEYLRAAALGAEIPAPIPEPNRKLWSELGRLSGNLNQAIRAYHESKLFGAALTAADIDIIRQCLSAVMLLRNELIGVAENEG